MATTEEKNSKIGGAGASLPPPDYLPEYPATFPLRTLEGSNPGLFRYLTWLEDLAKNMYARMEKLKEEL
ncbi:hypothetical protein CEXT_623241 [Caerostris extrusa]|uniref:Uncharacterized protein n=1 Tax=Caerostris extrusa TaxID=172846 RepID=A0AAV4TMD6_CAEEX|nr:hypothetical protein CEXT_623241 [Caerostris extrusa]